MFEPPRNHLEIVYIDVNCVFRFICYVHVHVPVRIILNLCICVYVYVYSYAFYVCFIVRCMYNFLCVVVCYVAC